MSEKNIISKSLCDTQGTGKLNFNEMDKSELLQMLAFMQSELEAREIVIATLKSEKCKQLLYQAKYGRLNTALISSKVNSELSNSNLNSSINDSIFLSTDPFSAMQRDDQCTISGIHQNSLNIDSSIESNLKPVYDSQLTQLENLISSQKKAQMRMKEQIVYLEKKCLKLTQALEDERNKHERDAAQGDDVLVMLEKERERLKSELEFERSHSRKLERELKRTAAVIEDQKTLIQNQRLAASVILKAKKQFENELKSYNQIISKSTNSNDQPNVECPKFHQDSAENAMSSNHAVKCNSSHRSHEGGSSDRATKHNQIVKSTRHGSHDGQLATNIHANKYSQLKDCIFTNISIAPVDTNAAHTSLNTTNIITTSKARTNKQPESLLWKTYDPKTSLPPTTGQCSAVQTLTNKSPSNSRRTLQNISLSNSSVPGSSFNRQSDSNFYKHSSIAVIPTTISVPITPYQKILSTPPSNSMMNNQTNSFQTTLNSYGLFSIHSSSLQNANAPSIVSNYKASISPRSEVMMTSNPAAHSSRSRKPGPSIVTNISSTVTAHSSSFSSSSTSSSSPLLRTGDSSPAIPSHVYVNGK